MKMVELNQKYVIEKVTKFLEKGRKGFNGSFNIKCESGKVKIDLSLSLVLGCQEQCEKEDSDLGSKRSKNLRADSEGISLEQRNTEPRKVLFRLSTKIVLPHYELLGGGLF